MYSTLQPPTWHKRPGSAASNESHDKTSIRSGASIATLALQHRQTALDELYRAGEISLEAVQDYFDRREDERYAIDLENVTSRRRQLKNITRHGEIDDLLFLFRSLVTRNIAGISNPYVEAPDLHDRKHTFSRYKLTVLQAADRIHEVFESSKDREMRALIYESVCDTISEFGKSATLLSGGGTLGMYHIGVLKTLRATNPRLISQVISGASAGSIVAAVFATKKDQDLDEAVYRLCHGDLNVFVGSDEQEQSVLERLTAMWKRRALFDPKNLSRVMKELLGEKLTFRDAFNLTGKRLNITASSLDSDKDDFQLLNYITCPDVLVWSAVVASCAVPFAFPKGQLYYRDADMTIKKVEGSSGHIDGSIYGDIPMDRMSREFNINYFVVSQVNPHVVPFLDTNKTLQRWFPYSYYSAGKKAAHGALLSVLERLKEAQIPGVGMLHSVFDQRYEGDLTLFPVRLGRDFRDIVHCLANPTDDFMDRAVEKGEEEGERMLPKAHAVLDVEMMLQDLKVQLKTKLKFSESEEDLHRRAIEDRMQSRPSYRALSQRGRGGVGGFHASTKSVNLPSGSEDPSMMPTSAKAHRTSQSLELGYMQLNTSAEKVAGSPTSSRSASFSTTTSSSSDSNDSGDGAHHSDHEEGGLRISMPTRNLGRFTSNPPSPLETRRRTYFPPSRSSSRSSSPAGSITGAAPMGLRMTPRTPSPEHTRKAGPMASVAGVRKETHHHTIASPTSSTVAGQRAGGVVSSLLPKSLRSLVDRQSGVTAPMSFRMGRGFRRKRSLSAAGVDEWVRGRERRSEQ